MCDKGFSFQFFSPDGDENLSTSVSAVSMAAALERHPDLADRKLEDVWCLGCANRNWNHEDFDGQPSAKWQDEWFPDLADRPSIPVERFEVDLRALNTGCAT
jgi:hypothetical protein